MCPILIGHNFGCFPIDFAHISGANNQQTPIFFYPWRKQKMLKIAWVMIIIWIKCRFWQNYVLWTEVVCSQILRSLFNFAEIFGPVRQHHGNSYKLWKAMISYKLPCTRYMQIAVIFMTFFICKGRFIRIWFVENTTKQFRSWNRKLSLCS